MKKNKTIKLIWAQLMDSGYPDPIQDKVVILAQKWIIASFGKGFFRLNERALRAEVRGDGDLLDAYHLVLGDICDTAYSHACEKLGIDDDGGVLVIGKVTYDQYLAFSK